MASVSPERRRARIWSFLDRGIFPYLPYPHVMWLAPLDAVLRLLCRPFSPIPIVYWPRLALLLAISALVTVGSLPERGALAVWLWLWPPRMNKREAPIFVLGYFRSGTTFLQTLLAADPTLRSPRWAEVLAPQTFVVGWMIFRYLLIPFLPLTGLGTVKQLAPNSPAEDDFALNNWGLVSIMAGRAVLPRRQAFYDRFHDLDSLSPRERARWRAYQRAFIGKLMLIARGRRLVLKSPSHTARVRFLLELFPGAKFIHISRSPGLVFQSNLLLVHTLQRAFALQYPVAGDEQEEIIAREYLATEQRYLTDKASIPTGDLAEVRLQDLSVDPIGELKRIYRELGLSFSVVYERRLPAILAAQGKRSANKHPELSDAQKARVARLEPLVVAFGHDRPTVAMAASRGPESSSNSWPATNREPVQH